MAESLFCFEVSWEVCNKVGGIYTVVKSKAGRMIETYGERYFAIGPYFIKKALGEFEEKPAPDFLKGIFESLKKEGIVCHYGSWLIEAEANAILIDFTGFTARTNEVKAELWNNFKIDSLHTAYFDFDEPVVWAYSVGRLIEQFSRENRIVAHFHEWLSGAGILYLKGRKAGAATVFTTHATVLGRSMASSRINIYGASLKVNPEEDAYRLGINAKHQVEKCAASNADVFTTVSEVTAIEAERLLGRKPDVILPNGLNLDKFPTFDEASVRHNHFKAKIKEFITYYFFPYYTFDLDNTLIYFLSGRYEFHDKGVDIFIRSLAKLNSRLKQEKSDAAIVAFFWIPGNIKGIKPDLLENRTFYEDIKESIEDSTLEIKERLLYLSIAQKKIVDDELLGKDLMLEIKRKVMRLFRKGSPGLSTHDLSNEESDEIMGMFRNLGLSNAKEDRVKVVFYPIYLTGADRLLDLNYYEAMAGSHLGVFPSFYEPWGYTPMEAGALGVSSVTTDLAGFGKYISGETNNKKEPGIFVIKRLDRSDEQVSDELLEVMHRFARMGKEERIRNKIEAKRIVSNADWKYFIKNYVEAHKLAARKKWGKE
ncbi:glycogen/starch synthase [Candidatus Woesearchaeota archaeon]|nr:glycogen/starch synthase [Candidatus Woesearchaeota archaeon]